MSEGGTSRTVDSEGGDVRPTSNQSTSRKRIKILPPKRDGNSRIAASEVGSPSNHSTSMKRTKPSPGPPPPRVQLNLNFDGLLLKWDFDRLAPFYELVEVRGFILTPVLYTYHFNFIARPKDGTDAENKLFFAEVQRRRCTCCCILGPPDSETGLCGCDLYCGIHPNHVQHPPQGGFLNKIFCDCDEYCHCDV